MKELKPCPFCGNKDVTIYGDVDGKRSGVCWVSCSKCGATSGNRKTVRALAAAWNKRVTDALPPKSKTRRRA